MLSPTSKHFPIPRYRRLPCSKMHHQRAGSLQIQARALDHAFGVLARCAARVDGVRVMAGEQFRLAEYGQFRVGQSRSRRKPAFHGSKKRPGGLSPLMKTDKDSTILGLRAGGFHSFV